MNKKKGDEWVGEGRGGWGWERRREAGCEVVEGEVALGGELVIYQKEKKIKKKQKRGLD